MKSIRQNTDFPLDEKDEYVLRRSAVNNFQILPFDPIVCGVYNP